MSFRTVRSIAPIAGDRIIAGRQGPYPADLSVMKRVEHMRHLVEPVARGPSSREIVTVETRVPGQATGSPTSTEA